jgi:hypothetical protein
LINRRGILYLYAPSVAKEGSEYILHLVARKKKGNCVAESPSVTVKIHVVPPGALLTSEAYMDQLTIVDRSWETDFREKDSLQNLVRYSNASVSFPVDMDEPVFEVVGYYLSVSLNPLPIVLAVCTL